MQNQRFLYVKTTKSAEGSPPHPQFALLFHIAAIALQLVLVGFLKSG